MGQYPLGDAKRSQNSLTENPVSKMWNCKLMLTNLGAALMWDRGWWSRNMFSFWSMQSLLIWLHFSLKNLFPQREQTLNYMKFYGSNGASPQNFLVCYVELVAEILYQKSPLLRDRISKQFL